MDVGLWQQTKQPIIKLIAIYENSTCFITCSHRSNLSTYRSTPASPSTAQVSWGPREQLESITIASKQANHIKPKNKRKRKIENNTNVANHIKQFKINHHRTKQQTNSKKQMVWLFQCIFTPLTSEAKLKIILSDLFMCFCSPTFKNSRFKERVKSTTVTNEIIAAWTCRNW